MNHSKKDSRDALLGALASLYCTVNQFKYTVRAYKAGRMIWEAAFNHKDSMISSLVEYSSQEGVTCKVIENF